MNEHRAQIAIIGAGVAGVATAYYLCTRYKRSSVILIDSRPPLSFTSAQSGDNYRNWWPHPVMVEFTDRGIDLMEAIARDSSNAPDMTRRGYALATRRADIGDLIAELRHGYGGSAHIRIHEDGAPSSYHPASTAWEDAPKGVDVLSHHSLIGRAFPSFSKDIAHVLHVRRAGNIDSQAMGQHMLGRIRDAGGKCLRAEILGIERGPKFTLCGSAADGRDVKISAEVLVNAAGPFAPDVAAMIGSSLPIDNVFQQKIVFDDVLRAVPREMPFSIDLDNQTLDWTDEERGLLADDPDMEWLIKPMSGGAHCRPDGGDDAQRVKLGWAYNTEKGAALQDPVNDPHFDPQFPEIVLRAAAALNPSLRAYVDEPPARYTHYGGYYPLTKENWPLIGPLGVDGAFVVGALSGFGSMAACAAGELCAAWVAGGAKPGYARMLSLDRYRDEKLITELRHAANKGIL